MVQANDALLWRIIIATHLPRSQYRDKALARDQTRQHYTYLVMNESTDSLVRFKFRFDLDRQSMIAIGNSDVSDKTAALDFIGKLNSFYATFVTDLNSSKNLEVIDGNKLILQCVFDKTRAVVIPKTIQSVRIPPVSLHTKKEMISTESDNRYENSFNGEKKNKNEKKENAKSVEIIDIGRKIALLKLR